MPDINHYKRFKYTAEMTADERIEISKRTGFLDLNGLGLTKLPPLAQGAGLHTLWCGENALTSLEGVPDSVEYLEIENNRGIVITVLPPKLTHLWCAECGLTTLPPLPRSLEYICFRRNELTTLPLLPPYLTELDCCYNSLTSIPALPVGLKRLVCYRNNLKDLPHLPASLVEWDFRQNPWSPRFEQFLIDADPLQRSRIQYRLYIDLTCDLRHDGTHTNTKKAVNDYNRRNRKLESRFNKLLLFEDLLRTKTVLNNDVISNITSFITGHSGSFATQAALVSSTIASGYVV